MAGPQANFRVDNSEDINVQGISSSLDIINFYNDVDFGLSFGAQYETEMGLTIGANYYLGLTDVIDNPIISELRNSSFPDQCRMVFIPIGNLNIQKTSIELLSKESSPRGWLFF